jgi:hypothetical protein
MLLLIACNISCVSVYVALLVVHCETILSVNQNANEV